MTKRIPIKKKKKVNRLAKYLGISRNDLKKVEKGKELRGLEFAYHINEKYHPDTITKIHVGKIHFSMKYQIVKWLKEGKIFIEK